MLSNIVFPYYFYPDHPIILSKFFLLTYVSYAVKFSSLPELYRIQVGILHHEPELNRFARQVANTGTVCP